MVFVLFPPALLKRWISSLSAAEWDPNVAQENHKKIFSTRWPFFPPAVDWWNFFDNIGDFFPSNNEANFILIRNYLWGFPSDLFRQKRESTRCDNFSLILEEFDEFRWWKSAICWFVHQLKLSVTNLLHHKVFKYSNQKNSTSKCS